MSNRILIFATLVTLAVPGCGGESRTPVYPVNGSVTRDGKPVAKATVVFHPSNPAPGSADDPDAGARVAAVDDQGHFALSTYQPDDGVPAGDYTVTIQPPLGPDSEQRDGPAPPVRVDKILAKYAKKETSPLKATVKAGDNSGLNFDLK